MNPNHVTQPASPSKAKQLRALLESPELEFILEAHNGISARIVEQAGFRGIWASGLAISAQFGVRDSNEASWTQVVDMLEFMSDVTTIPILLDGDTGYGNFNNMRRLVKKLEQRNVAGVCIEDKIFPKTNSFIDGERQPLADIDEFCGKIKAGKDSQTDPDFCIVARVEALIAGWDIPEALRRAEAYHAAGADAILIHSKLSRPDEVVAFAKEWDNRLPLVIVPTKYYSTPVEVFRAAGVSLVIWANHMIRASVDAMEQVSRHIKERESLIQIEDQIASVNRIFELQGADELSRAQERYLKHKRAPHAIVLAASRGRALRELTEDRPKVMLSIGGKPLLRRLVDEFKKQSINHITVVAGYKAEAINVANIQLRINADYDRTGELASLLCAADAFHDDMIVMYGDLLFRSYILHDLLEQDSEIVAVVDSSLNNPHTGHTQDLAYCTEADNRSIFQPPVLLQSVRDQPLPGERNPSGRWIGMVRFRNQGRLWLDEALTELRRREDFVSLGMPELLNHLIERGHPVRVHYVHGHWLDVNALADIGRAHDFTRGIDQ
jgi:phosphoenolpyruvate phosphomutase